MSDLSQEDYEFIYWHAMTKLRAGNFFSAQQLFQLLMEERPSFFVGMALAYCHYRQGELEDARQVLPYISPSNPREEKLYNRLCKRAGL